MKAHFLILGRAQNCCRLPPCDLSSSTSPLLPRTRSGASSPASSSMTSSKSSRRRFYDSVALSGVPRGCHCSACALGLIDFRVHPLSSDLCPRPSCGTSSGSHSTSLFYSAGSTSLLHYWGIWDEPIMSMDMSSAVHRLRTKRSVNVLTRD